MIEPGNPLIGRSGEQRNRRTPLVPPYKEGLEGRRQADPYARLARDASGKS